MDTVLLGAGELAGDLLTDPHAVYARLRERGPVHWVRLPDGQEMWLVVGYDIAREALTDARLSKDLTRIGATSFDQEFLGPHLLVSDPPQHTRLRRLVSKEFTPRRVAAMADGVHRQVAGLLDAMQAASRSRPVTRCWCHWHRPTATRRGSSHRTGSTSATTAAGISRSVMACTTASARHWPGWRVASRSVRCWNPCCRPEPASGESLAVRPRPSQEFTNWGFSPDLPHLYRRT